MKKRKGVIILTVIAALLLVAAAALYLVGHFALSTGPSFSQLFEFVKNAVTNFNDLLVTIPVFAVAGLWLVLTIIWIIVDAKRKKGVVALFAILFLLSAGVLAAYYPYFYNSSAKFTNFVVLELITAISAAASYIFFIILFAVDLATGKKKAEQVIAPVEEKTEAEPVYEEIKDEEEVKEEKQVEETLEEEKKEEEELEEEEFEEEEEEAVEEMVDEPKEKKAAKKKVAAKKGATKEKAPAKEKAPSRATQTVLLTNEDGQVYAKAYHVSRRPELNKWQVKATGSKKVLKLFNTQKEAIEYAESLSKSTGASVRVHSKAGKIRKHK